MTTPKNTPDAGEPSRIDQTLSKYLSPEQTHAVHELAFTYASRAEFFHDTFVKKVKDGNRRALSELTKFAMPPTRMDLRKELEKCTALNVPDEHVFEMKDGRQFSLARLKTLIPEWATAAEKSLIESDPALTDKLMSITQWNARVAFEVAFVNATNELKEIKKKKQTNGNYDHYFKWYLAPLHQALEGVKAINPPGNSLIGYGEKIPLRQAVAIAENLSEAFRKVC